MIPLDKIKAIDIIVNESKEEIFKEVNGESVSYDPPQYESEYAFNVSIAVNNPYFDVMKFELSSSGSRPKDQFSEDYKALAAEAKRIQDEICGGEFRIDQSDGSLTLIDEEDLDGDEWQCACGQVNDSNFCSACGKPRPSGVKWFCPDCGKENYGQFCTDCGRKKPD